MDPEGSEKKRIEQQTELWRERLRGIMRRSPGEVAERVYDHVENLRTRHPSISEYAAYNVLAGHSMLSPTKLDFPGKDSIDLFLEKLDKEFPGKSE